MNNSDKSPRKEMGTCLYDLVNKGVQHGFAHIEVDCETIKGGKRAVTIRAGNSHRFVLPNPGA